MPAKLTKEDILIRFNETHGDRYDYSEVDFSKVKNQYVKIPIKCKEHGLFYQIIKEHFSGHGCMKCSVIKRAKEQTKSLEDFIKEASLIHKNKYDYSESVYINDAEKIKINCPIHNSFWQSPNTHLKGQGCLKCGILRVDRKEITLELFLKRAKEKYLNKYDYSKIVYKKYNEEIEIICPKHGSIFMTPNAHIISDTGCYKCGIDERAQKQKLTLEEFLEKALKVHGDTYDYSLSICKGNQEEIAIICKEHGVFMQKPVSHLLGHGCSQCGQERLAKTLRLTLEEFLEKAKATHGDKYDYSECVYKSYRKKVKIICKLHGAFWQTPANHISLNGCPRCSHYISKSETAWLDIQGIPVEYRNIKLPGLKRINVDGFDPNTNTVFEFYGDYWHGNPDVFSKDKFNKDCNKTFGELYEKTMKREMLIIEKGYSIISIWENDFKNMIKSIKKS